MDVGDKFLGQWVLEWINQTPENAQNGIESPTDASLGHGNCTCYTDDVIADSFMYVCLKKSINRDPLCRTYQFIQLQLYDLSIALEL